MTAMILKEGLEVAEFIPNLWREILLDGTYDHYPQEAIDQHRECLHNTGLLEEGKYLTHDGQDIADLIRYGWEWEGIKQECNGAFTVDSIREARRILDERVHDAIVVQEQKRTWRDFVSDNAVGIFASCFIVVVIVLGFGLSYLIKHEAAGPQTTLSTAALVEEYPQLAPMWDEALEDGKLSNNECWKMEKKAAELVILETEAK